MGGSIKPRASRRRAWGSGSKDWQSPRQRATDAYSSTVCRPLTRVVIFNVVLFPTLACGFARGFMLSPSSTAEHPFLALDLN
jgi:hypothetical protein